MFVTNKNYEEMYKEVKKVNEVYMYMMLGFGLLCMIGIIASVLFTKRYQQKMLNFSRKKNQLNNSPIPELVNYSSEKLITTSNT